MKIYNIFYEIYLKNYRISKGLDVFSETNVIRCKNIEEIFDYFKKQDLERKVEIRISNEIPEEEKNNLISRLSNLYKKAKITSLDINSESHHRK